MKYKFKIAAWVGASLLIAGFALIGAGALAADGGARAHAEGQYDASTNTYTVAAGDELSAIAERFGATVDALEAQNKFTSDKITVGQKLVIGAAAETADLIPSRAPFRPAWARRASVLAVRNSAFSKGLNSLRGTFGMGGSPSGSRADEESLSICSGLVAIC